MLYTVWHRGRVLGHTSLEFRRGIRGARLGWFHPTPEGERVMPVVSAVPAAMRALARGHCLADDGEPRASSSDRRATLLADLAEALQHLQSLELQLRREDGSVVPVSEIGLQDADQLGELGRLDLVEPTGEVDWECDDGDFPTAAFDPDDPEGLGGLRELDDLDDLDGLDELDAMPFLMDAEDDRRAGASRFQIVVRLVDDEDLP